MNRIKELLAERGWTQRQLAEKINKHPNHVSAIINGDGANLVTAQLIAQALGETVDNVFPPPTEAAEKI